MDTMTRHRTDCGLVLAREGDAVYPLTPCCGVVADPGGSCSRCWRSVPDGCLLAALIGQQHARRDLRQMIESLTHCPTPGACAGELLERISGTS